MTWNQIRIFTITAFIALAVFNVVEFIRFGDTDDLSIAMLAGVLAVHAVQDYRAGQRL